MSGVQEQDFEKDKKVDLKIWKRLVRYAWRYKKTVIFLIATLIAVALVDIAYPLMSRYAINNFVEKGTTEGLVYFCVTYVVLVAFQSFGVFNFVRLAGRIEMNVSYDIRQDAFKKLQELSFSFYDKTAVGYLMARMVSDIARLSEMIAWSVVDLMWALAYVVGVIIAMLALDTSLALLVLIVIPPLAVVSVIFQKKILKYQRRVRKVNSRITGSFNEGIMGAMTSKTLVREKANAEEFTGLTGDMRRPVRARSGSVSSI